MAWSSGPAVLRCDLRSRLVANRRQSLTQTIKLLCGRNVIRDRVLAVDEHRGVAKPRPKVRPEQHLLLIPE